MVRSADHGIGRLKSSTHRSHYFNVLTADIHAPVTVDDSDTSAVKQPPVSFEPTVAVVDADTTSRDSTSSGVIIHRHGVKSSWQRDARHLQSRGEAQADTDTRRSHVQSTSQQSVTSRIVSVKSSMKYSFNKNRMAERIL